MSKLKQWLQYRREVRAWQERRPYTGFTALEPDLQNHVAQIARSLHEWELSKPPKQENKREV